MNIDINDTDTAGGTQLSHRPGRRTTRVARRYGAGGVLFLVAVTLGLGLAGCGSSKTNGGSASASPSASADTNEQLVRFSQCMRQNGVPSFPDPVNGQMNLQVTKGGPLDPSNPAFQSAREKCKSLEPPGVLGGGQNTQQQDQMLKFVSCMRTNGVPNFPDPQNGQFRISGNDVDPNSPAFQKAIQACRNLLPGGAVVGGGGQ